MRLLWPVALALVAMLSSCNQDQCEYNGNCATGLVCVAKQCVAPASTGADHCPGGQLQCTEANQCASQKCTDGCCSPPCLGPGDCDVTESCVDGACVAMVTPTGCQKNADCAAPTKYCLASTSACVECRSTTDCGVGSYKTCDPETHACVYPAGGCGADADCEGVPSIPICDVAQHLCVGCLSSTDCAAEESCSSLQTCVPAPPEHCHMESDCVGNIHGYVHCDTTQDLCVRCVSNSQCSSSQICRVGSCVPRSGCEDDGDCGSSSAHPYCNTDTGVCLGCFDTNQCTAGKACVNHECGQCTSNADCDTSSAGRACRLDLGVCSQCNVAEDCSRAGAACENHLCVGGACGQDADCANSPGGSYCVNSTCVQCRTAEQCSFNLSCFQNKCQEPICDSDDDCTTAVTGPHCDTAERKCYRCATNAQCPRTLVCDKLHGHVCTLLACNTDPDCASDETAQHCDSQTHICAECASNTDCPPELQCVAGSCGDHSTCMHGDCGTSALCVPIPVNNYTDWTERCVQPRTSGAAGGAPCAAYSDCASGQCFHVAGNTTDGICLDTCTPSMTNSATGCATTTTTTCPASGMTLTLPGPDGIFNPTTPSDDVVGVVKTCWSRSCAKDNDCNGTGFRLGGASAANRVCGPTPNPVDPTMAPAFSCLPLTGYVRGGMPCFDNQDCQSNICLPWMESSQRTTGRCFGTCGVDGDCPTIDHAAASCLNVNVKLGTATLPLKSCIFHP